MNKKILIFAFCFIFLALSVTAAQAKSWYFDSWEVDIDINEDSSFVVSEKQTFNFDGDFSWVTRNIAKKDFFDIDDVKVFDQEGNQLIGESIEITEDPSYLYIKIYFDLSDTVYAWTFEYTIYGGLGFFEDQDELYWNAVSSDRDVKIEKVIASVTLPEKQDLDDIVATTYSGAYGYETTVGETLFLENGDLYYEGSDIGAFDNFTIVAGWPKNVVSEPGYLYVESTPGDIGVVIDGQDTLKVTPAYFLIGSEVEEGVRSIELNKLGHETSLQNVSLEKGVDNNLSIAVVEKAWYKSLKILFFALAGLYFLSPLVVLIYLITRWKKYGKDPKGKGTIIPQYEAPGKVSPAVMGTLYDERVDMKDISSAIIDLAFRGYLKIKEESKKGFLQKGKTYTFFKEKDFQNDSNLKSFERNILKGMFGNTKVKVKLSELSNKFYKKLPAIKKDLYQEMMGLDYFHKDPDKVRKQWRGWGIGLASFGMFTSFFYLIGVPILLIGILISFFAGFMPQKTIKGVLAKEHAQGFKMYLHTAERFRLKDVKPEAFEKFLSYAIVLGVEKEWAERFVDIYKAKPAWFESDDPIGTWSIHGFAANMSTGFASSVSSSFSSTPGGTSGGGTSGFSGGFSGGGGGGGGSGAG